MVVVSKIVEVTTAGQLVIVLVSVTQTTLTTSSPDASRTTALFTGLAWTNSPSRAGTATNRLI